MKPSYPVLHIVKDRAFRDWVGYQIPFKELDDVIKRYTDKQGVIADLFEAGYLQNWGKGTRIVAYLPEELDFALEVFYLTAIVDCKLPPNVSLRPKQFKQAVWLGCYLLGINQDREGMWRVFELSKYFNTGLSLKDPYELDLKLMSGFKERDLYLEFRQLVSPPS